MSAAARYNALFSFLNGPDLDGFYGVTCTRPVPLFLIFMMNSFVFYEKLYRVRFSELIRFNDIIPTIFLNCKSTYNRFFQHKRVKLI